MLDLDFFKEILSVDSTSGKEAALLDLLRSRLSPSACSENWLLLSYGTPQVVFCTHIDTVPPYLPPAFLREDGTPCPPAEAFRICGRGSCDAKGQLLAMLAACRQLEAEGCTGFGLLLLTGEETGSWGAKAFAQTSFRAPFLIVGEPTENKMVSAAKGTKAFALTFHGHPFHSGYPQYGTSAVDRFLTFCNALNAEDFGDDPVLGPTTWNIGRLVSDNPQNILSAELCCRLYFRTTFVSDEAVVRWMNDAARTGEVTVEAIGGDAPAQYLTLPGFDTAPVAFGSDAPHLTNFTHKAICGPGSIRFAHRDDEHVLVRDLETAAAQYVRMYRQLIN